jgi:hypothetical protein
MQKEMARQDVGTGAVQVAVAMAGDRIGLPVMFRTDELSGRTFALLPTLPGERTVSKCVSHTLGGIVTAENVYLSVRDTRPATPTEFRALMEELTRTYAGNHLIGYVGYNDWFNRTRGKNLLIQLGVME